MSKKPPTTGDRLRAQHQWHARSARGGFSTMIFPIKVKATPPMEPYTRKLCFLGFPTETTGGKIIF